MIQARRGRPRQERVGPTREWLEKARAKIGPDADLVLAESPLGVMLARKKISQRMYDAGYHYAWLYGQIFGKTCPSKINDGGGKLVEPDDDRLERLEGAYREASDALRRAGGRVKAAVDDLTVFKRFYWPGNEFFDGMRILVKWRYG